MPSSLKHYQQTQTAPIQSGFLLQLQSRVYVYTTTQYPPPLNSYQLSLKLSEM